MGLVSLLLGKENPVSQFVDSRQNTLNAWGAGLASGPNFQQGLSKAVQYGAQAAPLDQQAAEQKRIENQLLEERSRTAEYLRSVPGGEKFADAIEHGGVSGSEAFKMYYDSLKPGEQKNPYMSAGDGTFFNWQTGDFLTNPNMPQGGANAPAGVQEYQFAQTQGYGGTYQDWLREKSAAGRAPMNSTVQKELFEAEDAAKAGEYVISALDRAMMLNDKAYDGPFADVRGDTTALFGDPSGVATAELKNITTETALSQLKTIFGSMPTEGERKILLELQGAVSQPKQVRAAIYKRAKEMAVRRIADNKAKADALRSGEYFDPNYSGQQPGGVDDILKKYGL